MLSLTLQDITKATQGQLCGQDQTVEHIVTDTRQSCAGALFVALKGEHFDAHHFLHKAVEANASALVFEKQAVKQGDHFDVPYVLVDNTLKALGQIAHFIRKQVKATVIGITGSCGKTTVKEMITCILSQKGKTLSTHSNFNNEVGVPKTLFRLDDTHEFAVVEMGAAKEGDIQYLTQIVEPDVALVTNVSAAHLEGFGSVDIIAKTKGEIYRSLSDKGIAVVNLDDDYSEYWINNLHNPLLTLSCKNSVVSGRTADVTVTDIEEKALNGTRFSLHYQGECIEIHLAAPGRHNVNNAVAAASVALACELDLKDIKTGLEGFSGVEGRLQRYYFDNQLCIIDDTYNANVASTTAAIHVLAQCEGKKYLVLGDMAELGDESQTSHQTIGKIAKQLAIDCLVTTGEWSVYTAEAFGEGARHFSNKKNSQDWLIQQLAITPGNVLVKGSRSSKMEQVVEELLSWANQTFQEVNADAGLVS